MRSYRTISPLPFDESKGGIFLLHFPSGCPAWTLSSTVPCAVRTFLIPRAKARGTRSPLLPQVKTFLGSDESDLAYILDHLEELVVKTVDGSGGYGMLIGPASSSKERTASL